MNIYEFRHARVLILHKARYTMMLAMLLGVHWQCSSLHINLQQPLKERRKGNHQAKLEMLLGNCMKTLGGF